MLACLVALLAVLGGLLVSAGAAWASAVPQGSGPRGGRAGPFWLPSQPLLDDDGGAVRLTTFDGIVLACGAWGDGAC